MPREPKKLTKRMADNAVRRGVDDCLVAMPHLMEWLKEDHPPFDASLPDALRHYGPPPSAALDLWCGCRALERLRIAVEAREELLRPPRTPVNG